MVQKVTITAVGDCTLGVTQTHGYAGSFHEYYDKYGEDYFFKDVRSIFEQDDFTLVNLECVLSNSNDRIEKTWNLKGKPEYVGILTGSSVEGCSLGNNHTYDYSESGLQDTINVLNEKHANYIRDGIKSLRDEGADLVIASCHWGIEGDHYPNSYQQEMAHQVIDWGADVLIGSHPHVLQGVELYNGKVICYSLGNFCFGGNRNPKVKDTAIYQQTFTFSDGILQKDISADIIPCTISSTTARNDFQPTVAEGERKQAILDDMNDYSKPYSQAGFDSSGKLMVLEEEE